MLPSQLPEAGFSSPFSAKIDGVSGATLEGILIHHKILDATQ